MLDNNNVFNATRTKVNPQQLGLNLIALISYTQMSSLEQPPAAPEQIAIG